MTKLLIAIPCKEEFQKWYLQEFSDHYAITFAQGDEEIIAREIRDAEVVIGEPAIPVLLTAPKLKWLQITWAGADTHTKGFPENIILTNASGVFGRVISEYTLGMILAQYKRFPEYYVNQKKKIWTDLGTERSLLGKRALILGTGNVGGNIAQKLQAFGTYTIGINRSGKCPEHFDEAHPVEELDKFLPEADLVIGALPRTPWTEGLFDYRRMQLIQKDALLVNVGRGTMIITKDLEKLLEEGHFSGVVLDVMDPEPLPESSPLWTNDRVLLTPHISGIGFDHDPATEHGVWALCADNLRRYRDGLPLKHVVDIHAGY